MRIKIGKCVDWQGYKCLTIRRIYKRTVTLQSWWCAGDMVIPEFRLFTHVPILELRSASKRLTEFSDIGIYEGN